jgi:hypothetical protein
LLGNRRIGLQRLPFDEVKLKYSWLVSIVVLVITGLIALFPGTAIGFFGEDHVVLDEAIRMPLLDYTVYMFGQCVRPMFCRPAEALGIRFEYILFGNNPFAFRMLQMLIHLANCILLYVIAQKISRRSIVGLCAGLVYAALPIVVASFPWLGAADPGVTFLSLLRSYCGSNICNGAGNCCMWRRFSLPRLGY